MSNYQNNRKTHGKNSSRDATHFKSDYDQVRIQMDPNESVKGNIEIESAYRATQSIHEDEFNTVRDANPLLNASREGSEPASRIFTAVYSIDGNH